MNRLKIFWAFIIIALIGTTMSMQSCSSDDDSNDKTCVYKIGVRDYQGENIADYIKNIPDLIKISKVCYKYIGASEDGVFAVTGNNRADCNAKAIEKCKIVEKQLSADGYPIKVVYTVSNYYKLGDIISTITVN